MSQLIQNKSCNKIKQSRDPKQNKLGKAPNDIYDLENEIASITKPDDIEEHKENEENEYKLFSTSNLSEAKQALQNGLKIKVKLPDNPSPHALIAMVHSIGFDTTKLQKLFLNSSVVVKNMLDSYVTNLKSKYSSLSKMNHPYQSSSFGGYLFHCKQIDALQCDNDLSAKIRISMDLDYNNNVLNDDLFETKFKYELSNKVFKCSSNSIIIQDIRAGSVIVIIAGITLITLATLGLLTLSVKLSHRRKQKQIQRQRQRQKQNVKLIQLSPGCIEQRKKSNTTQLNANKYKEIKYIKPMNKTEIQQPIQQQQQQTFVSSIFNKIKTGINTFNEQYTEPQKGKKMSNTFGINAPTPNGLNNNNNNNNNNIKGADKMYNKLIDMGFNNELCQKAAKQYPSDINQAINWIMEHENDAKEKEEEKEKEKEKDNDNDNSPDIEENEDLILNINDPLWINKKNQLWSATVIALSRYNVTIEYDNGGPYLWRKTETFALNDQCLVQKQPGMSPYIEGCVQISKSNGGYIKAWKTGLARPMADI